MLVSAVIYGLIIYIAFEIGWHFGCKQGIKSYSKVLREEVARGKITINE